MREIKFRAWDESRSIMSSSPKWVEFRVKVDGTLYAKNFKPSYIGKGEQELIIMQYTGLKDKNGKEIYEGDIVRILYTDWMSKHMGTEEQKAMSMEEYLNSISFIDEVIFEDLSYTLKKGSIHCGRHGFIEVIGNIYENKELLEG